MLEAIQSVKLWCVSGYDNGLDYAALSMNRPELLNLSHISDRIMVVLIQDLNCILRQDFTITKGAGNALHKEH
jgi:hypothetical protein